MAEPIFKYAIDQKYVVPDGYAGNYRYGTPEGIVYHEAGNPNNTGANAFDNEWAYMKNNYRNSFVHAWAGHDRIWEMANTDYMCWGAGPHANPRFIQIEIPRYSDKDLLRKAFDREAFWGAVQLWYYNLECTIHTVWTHHDVTKYLGGTDHTDPTWLLGQIGKTDKDLFNVTKAYYDVLKAGGDTRKVAGFTSTSTTVEPVVASVAPKAVTNTSQEFVIGSYATVYEKPDFDSKVLQTHKVGAKVNVIGWATGKGIHADNVWATVTSNDYAGYIHRDQLVADQQDELTKLPRRNH